VAGKGATRDASILIAHCEDGWDGFASRLTRIERQKSKENEISVNYVTIPQVAETYSYWAQGLSTANARQAKNGDWILNGMNEHGVVVTCNMMNGCRESVVPDGKGVTRYTIRKLILERAKTARQGMSLIGQLVDKYTLSGKAVAFCIADSEEIWLVETTPRHWVAKKIANSQYHIEPNHFTIGKTWDRASDGLVSYAQTQGWYSPDDGEFSFKDSYADPAVFSDPFNSARVYQAECILGNTLNRKIDLNTLRSLVSQPPVMDHRNQATFIWHLKNKGPQGLGAKMWFSNCGAAINGMAPIYAVSKKVPDSYRDSPGSYDVDSNSSYWNAFVLQQKLYPGLWVFGKYYLGNRLLLDRFQAEIDGKTDDVESRVIALYAKGENRKAEELLSSHTFSELNRIAEHTDNMIKKYDIK